MSLEKLFRCLCLLLMTILMGCASAMQKSDFNADTGEVIHAIAPSTAQSGGQPLLDEGEVSRQAIEAFPETLEEPSPDGLSEQGGIAVVAAVPFDLSDSERSIDLQPQPSQSSTAYDPWERFNRRVHHLNTVVDKAVAQPVALA